MATRKKEGAGPSTGKPRGAPVSLNRAEPVPVFAIEQPENAAQMRLLEQGLRLFQQHRFVEAREFFEKAATGPQSAVALTAKNHIVVCDRRTQTDAPGLQSAEDHYNIGVERLNARDLRSACDHLKTAASLKPQCEYMLYALAAALALSGDAAGSCENLKRAIQGNPRNRNTARLDPDFAGLSHDPHFVALLVPERS
jgi:tetratricopeptide (TPR) repeat protein